MQRQTVTANRKQKHWPSQTTWSPALHLRSFHAGINPAAGGARWGGAGGQDGGLTQISWAVTGQHLATAPALTAAWPAWAHQHPCRQKRHRGGSLGPALQARTRACVAATGSPGRRVGRTQSRSQCAWWSGAQQPLLSHDDSGCGIVPTVHASSSSKTALHLTC